MGKEGTRRHPIDYEVHPVGGWFLAVWGLLMCIGPVARGPGEDSLRVAVELLWGVGILLLGVALLIPMGRVRKLVVGAWLLSIAGWLTLMVFGFAA